MTESGIGSPSGRDSVSPVDVCAVLYGECSRPRLAELVRAVCDQTTAPRLILVPREGVDATPAAPDPASPRLRAYGSRGSEGGFSAAVSAGASTGAAWIWLLDGEAVPAPGALRALRAAVPELAARWAPPLLLASKVLDSEGGLHAQGVPRHEVFEKERSVEAAERHLVQLRTAAHGSLLIAAEAVQRFGLPRVDLPPGLDMIEWTARILRRWEDSGYLVPASVAVRHAPPAVHPRGYWLGRLRMVGSRGWTPTEKLWETFLLGEAVAHAVRGPARQGRAGVGTPGLSPSRSPRRMIGTTRALKRLTRR